MKKIIVLFIFVMIVSCKSEMRKVEFVAKVKTLKEPVIAKVNNIPITVEDYNREKNKLPPDLRALLKDPGKRLQFVQNLIDKELLYEQSKKLNIDKLPEFQEKLQQIKRDLMIDEFLKIKISSNIYISNKEIKNYYKKHEKEFSKPLNKVKDQIIKILKNKKEKVLFQKYLNSLRKSAKIEINTKELQKLN